jgi:NDP-sugar pyrophosphorylase family protein
MKTSVAPHAVILAAGLGSRLQNLTASRPKPLVEVHGTPILHNALRNLAAVGVKEATIVVGYRKEVIMRSCGQEFAGLRVKYVESTAFDRTGSAYSLWLARDALLEGTSLLLEGDVFFERAVLTRLLSSAHEDVGGVAPLTAAMSGSAVTLSEGGVVQQILMNQSASDQHDVPRFKTMNLYRFTAATAREVLVPALDEAIRSGATKVYVEQILSGLVAAQILRLGAESCSDLKWFEIDNQSDLRLAEEIFAPQLLRATHEPQILGLAPGI